MKREEIEKMPAGNKMDTLIELDVFGWPKAYDDALDVPKYSTEISVAWQVVEKMKADGFPLRMNIDAETAGYPGNNGVVWCAFKYSAFGNTAPLAICRAALMTTADE